MIRTWVKNLCNYIDNLDTSFSTSRRYPIIADKKIKIEKLDGDLCLTFSDKNDSITYNNCYVKLELAESALLNDFIKKFRDRVNEARIIEFLKPFTQDEIN